MTEPPAPRAARDELVLKAYSLWLADREKAVALFRDQERLHEKRLHEYERTGVWMEEWGDDILKTDSARFASYAALRRGILSERGYAEWCRWVADRVGGEKVASEIPDGPPDKAGRTPKPQSEARASEHGVQGGVRRDGSRTVPTFGAEPRVP